MEVPGVGRGYLSFSPKLAETGSGVGVGPHASQKELISKAERVC